MKLNLNEMHNDKYINGQIFLILPGAPNLNGTALGRGAKGRRAETNKSTVILKYTYSLIFLK
jgi:hypothetical protein